MKIFSCIVIFVTFLGTAKMRMTAIQDTASEKTVLLDNYYNNEWKKDSGGINMRYHYTWNDKTNSGYSILGNIFNHYAVKTTSLTVAPTTQNLQKSSIYIIVDPDTDKETEKPNYMNAKEAGIIADWVKAGGVLVLLSNDAGNAEFKYFNQLPEKFGIQFNEDSKNKAPGHQFEEGTVITPDNHPIFKNSKKLFMKELSTLQVKAPAVTVLKKDNDNIMAVAKYGKGTVFALGDPWVYNECMDSHIIPGSFENYKAAEEWVQWLVKQSKN